MSANVEFNITAFDEASDVFNTVSSSATECFTTVTTGASEAAESVSSIVRRLPQRQNPVQAGLAKMPWQ